MRLSDGQIKKCLEKKEGVSRDEGRLQEIIQESKTAFYESEAKSFLSDAEFLYQQSKYICKRWWILQGSVLFLLWVLLEWTESSFYIHRCMGTAASLFAVLLLPELWKNRRTGAMEIECTAYYSLRQVYAARIFLFALIDLLLISIFSLATVLTGKILAEELMIQFFLPYIVTCCICFRTLYSRKFMSEAFALMLCTVWCFVWTQLALNEKVYEIMYPSIWFAMTIVAVFYLSYCIRKGQEDCKKIWEVKSLWN